MNKPTGKIIYSSIGIALFLVMVIALNVISSFVYFRVDMTEDCMHTLSPCARGIVLNLKEPVTIRFYRSKSNNRMPVDFKNYARRVEDLLAEYAEAGKGRIIVEKYDPVPYSDAADSAQMDGVLPQTLSVGDGIYMGLSIACLDKSEAIPFLAPEKENMLEYEITRAIVRVTSLQRPVVGVMSALPVFGGPSKPTPQMIKAGSFALPQPWFSLSELKSDFDLREIPLNADAIDKDIGVLLVIHPSGISDAGQFAIDQFVLRGGKLILMIDPASLFAIIKSQSDKSYYSMISSDPAKLLKAWGIKFNRHIVVADMTFARRGAAPGRTKRTYATFLQISPEGLNRSDMATGQLELLSMIFAGSLSGIPAEGLKKETLVHSTKDSQPVSSFIANKPEKIVKYFKPDGKVHDLAIRLSGHFKTAFPNGIKNGKEQNLQLKESVRDTEVVIVADTDWLVNDACVKLIKDRFERRFYIRENDNINFLQNLAEAMGGAHDLSGIRCRQILARPFSRIKEIHSKAEQDYKNKIVALEKDLKGTQDRMNKLQQQRVSSGKFILSSEQQAELEKFKAKAADARKELKALKKKLRQDIDRLGNIIKWLNIALMPIIVALFGMILAMIKKRRRSAR